MADNDAGRSPSRADQIMEELKRLQETSSFDRRSMLHEIAVYQEELVVQNEELKHAQMVLEETRDRYIELYDFAPSGYLTLDEHGVIRHCNLTAAALIGKSKQALEGIPFLAFVQSDDRSAYFDFLRRCRVNATPDIETELTILTGNGRRTIQLLARSRRTRDGARENLLSIIDVTDRKQLEHEREQIAREHAALATRLISIQDNERQRIARNLHDDLGQQVTALRMSLEELASAPANETMSARVARAQQVLHQLDQRLHFVAGELRPAALDLGIVAAIDHFVREWSVAFGVHAEFRAGGISPGMLPAHVETHMYRVTQEALNNAAKYAAARHVSVLLDRRDNGMVLMIEDDGRGFDLETTRSAGQGLGLVGMRERAQIVGGRLEVETSPGQGTSIYLHVPLQLPPS
jgi:PAS domain S-box-containing protein